MNQSHVHAANGSSTAVCRVTYRMTDQMGVVYYGNYLEMFEMGRVELLRGCGVSYREMEEDGYMLPVTHAACDYLASAKYDDLLEIPTRVATLTRAKIHFGYEIRRKADGLLIARGATHHVFLSPEGKLRRLSHAWMEKLEAMMRVAADSTAPQPEGVHTA